jgi:hypothetical protein
MSPVIFYLCEKTLLPESEHYLLFEVLAIVCCNINKGSNWLKDFHNFSINTSHAIHPVRVVFIFRYAADMAELGSQLTSLANEPHGSSNWATGGNSVWADMKKGFLIISK